MPILARYNNGNCAVTLHDDGTKVREWPDSSAPVPEFPESVDLKITNTCDLGCAWCHENAIKKEDHASLDRMLSAVSGLPAGVEIAIGGGNPLDHPSLEILLSGFMKLGLISNMTVHGEHALYNESIRFLQATSRLHGVGISGTSAYRMMKVNDMLPANSVCHAIVGVDDPLDIINMRDCAILILGYKTYGRGGTYRKGEIRNLGKWRYFIRAILQESKSVLSFDNLALSQLGIRDLVDDSTWAKHYMGDDGRFTMYFDAVKNQYAVSSTSDRRDAGEMTIPEMFREVIGQRR